MRVLLIDNHDSFTHNLVQLVRAVPGTEVVVLRNDAPLPPDWSTGFDAVVISPGPGHPSVDADVGISRVVLEHSDLPVLGVCLGHQLLAVLHGGVVDRSPYPRHGETSAVTHTGDALFGGIPTEFVAVRYHSLDVRTLPGAVVPIAHAADGTVMALRVRDQPRWGVQFHPESIESEHGATLVGNFLRLAAAARHRLERTHPARQRSTRVPGVRSLAQVLAAVTEPPRVVLDGVETPAGPVTVAGWDSPWSHRLSGVAGAGTRTTYPDGTVTETAASVLDELQRHLRRPVDVAGEHPGVALGYAGFLGYEMGFELLGLELPVTPDTGWPDSWWTLLTRAVVLRPDGECWVTGLDEPGDDASVADLDTWLRTPLDRPAGATDSATSRSDAALQLEYGCEQGEYLHLIATCQDAIARGESYELCLTNRLHGGFTGDPLAVFLAIRAGGRVPRAAYLRIDDRHTVVSGSPELFLAVDADGHARTEPIKGTRPATGDPATDDATAQELATSRKDRAENLMIVDLMRNDFSRVAVPGSTTVTGLYDVRRFPTVLQLVSTVECELPAGTGVVDLIRATFPPGSMTGAPKERSVRILGELERERRGVYSGAIGLLGLDGTATLSVAIRTLALTGDRFTLGVGGAITRLSDPPAEWQETLDKAQSALRALRRQDNYFPRGSQRAPETG
ncbi:chorismate-binding protein [Flexivirga oryzae]|uniref:aminodeoxychorismate synthase n=1 Tax=Flexivirga oryzae TaxID=1794944 RepID=A0A839NCL7_9MICO|nr:para-aminobenzoate synthetase [Flexivirga oryzae]